MSVKGATVIRSLSCTCHHSVSVTTSRWFCLQLSKRQSRWWQIGPVEISLLSLRHIRMRCLLWTHVTDTNPARTLVWSYSSHCSGGRCWTSFSPGENKKHRKRYRNKHVTLLIVVEILSQWYCLLYYWLSWTPDIFPRDHCSETATNTHVSTYFR